MSFDCGIYMQAEEFEDTKGVIQIRKSKNNRQTTQWPKEKGQKDKQRSIKHTHKTKDRVTRIPLKSGVKSGAPEGWAVETYILYIVH